ncbi:hypothetical protein EV189_3103 [Motilibacter rhizosphaerae]|uniref:Uncharacterized protein n=1 Tax=Motilibacter rhizosphaerae TaxID=598652 RepID=A0A4Q7NG41_9ACTN|nr:hypothetical protein [Motilibacter rhizosphaerae]RZS82708.1 hypothetical protein EV189_3103 [Motilibacter rhizosphaerae]
MLHAAVRGVSGRQGIYLTGKPQQMLVFDDGLVLVQASGALAVAPGGGATAGARLQASTRRGGDKGTDDGQEYAAVTKRSTFLPYDSIASAVLERGRIGAQRLRILTDDGRELSHAYQPLHGPDEELLPLLTGKLGERFTDERATT